MKCAGVIVEYNPFHNGHLHHIQKTYQSFDFDGLIAVMSGNWVQRGEPAILDKWQRAQMALNQGVDLVIELPFIWACQSAREFAEGSVCLLDSTGVVNYQTFGSESANLDYLNKAAKTLVKEPESLKIELKKHLNSGNSYPFALTKALNNYIDSGPKEITPNDILGIEYLKSHIKLNTNIKTSVVQRVGSNYHEEKLNSDIASATAIRKALEKGYKVDSYVPPSTLEILNKSKNELLFFKSLEKFILYRLRTTPPKELTRITGWEKGLENRLKKRAIHSTNLEEFFNEITSRRYTRGRINRYLVHLLMEVSKDKIKYFNKKGPPYIRILGMNSTGKSLIKKMKETAKLPVLTRPAKELRKLNPYAQACFNQEVVTTSFYNLLNNKKGDFDYTKQAIIADNY